MTSPLGVPELKCQSVESLAGNAPYIRHLYRQTSALGMQYSHNDLADLDIYSATSAHQSVLDRTSAILTLSIWENSC